MGLLEELKSRIILCDGGFGSLLQKAGLKAGELPETWNLKHPDIITDINRSYLEAGADIINANTFGANRFKYNGVSEYDLPEVVEAAVRCAKQAVKEAGHGYVALDIGPTGKLLEPMGELGFEEAVETFAEVVREGVRCGADLILIETMSDMYELKAAILAAKENSDLPVFTTVVFDKKGKMLTGGTPKAAAAMMESLGVDAMGINCSLGPKQMLPIVEEMLTYASIPVIVNPNAGLPRSENGETVYDVGPDEFAEVMKQMLDMGVSVIGGCCGTTPEYISRLKALAAGRTAPVITEKQATIVTSYAAAQEIGDDPIIVGERINPTGKKRFQQALLEGDLDYILDVAVQQEDAGADILDVNVGYPGVDEAVMLPRVVKKLQSAVSLPLQLDSSNPDALEAGLRVYNGKAAVNSVNGEREVLDRILPIVKKYGASVVGLTLDKSGIPQTAEGRVAIAKRILDAALSYGIPKEDVWIDCLTLTVSAQQEQAAETLKAVRIVREELGLQVVLGVSNISFGLPNRALITQNFLIQAMHAGLTLPIINPNQKEMMDAVAAFRVLSGEDRECRAYVARFAGETPTVHPTAATGELTLDDAIIRGLKTEAGKLAKAALSTESELALVERHLIPALDKVGEGYEAGKLFLPQLLSAAQAAQAVFEVIRSSIADKGGTPIKKGKLIVATVQGDIHDIGKNIVRTVLENYGYDVVDLGRDVPPQVIVQTVVEQDIRLVGLSALMTTTLPAMVETVQQLRKLPEPPVTFVGGAVVTPEYARQMGADYYAKDARQSVEIARKVLG